MTPWGDAPQPHWPEEGDASGPPPMPPMTPSAPAEPYGPRFAWRARLLWAFGAVIQIGAAVIVAGMVLMGAAIGAGSLLLAATLAIVGAAFVATRGALGRRQAWAGTPSLVLALGFILGGIARALIAFGSNTFLIPLEPLVGIWLLVAADRPPLRFGRPADWRTAAMVALVIAMELTNLTPIVPEGVPFIDSLGAGPEALELTLNVACPPMDALWARRTVEVIWRWRGVDLFAAHDDRLTLAVSGQAADSMSLDQVSAPFPVADRSGDAQHITFDIPHSTSAADLEVSLTGSGEAVIGPLTVTATYNHGGRWEKTAQTASCEP